MPSTTSRKPTRTQIGRFRWLLANVAWKSAGPVVVDRITRAVSLLKARTITPDQIQWVIDRLELLPLRAIPDGFYELGGHRYRLRTAVGGRWDGFTSVYAVNAAGEQAMLRGSQRRAVLAALGGVHVAAALRFGQQTQRCPYCNQQLDDPTSRRVGAGERCATDRGIPWE